MRKKPVGSQNVSTAREYLSPAACRSCGAMVGLAVCEGLACQVDLEPLARLDAARAVTEGRWVYEVRGHLSRRWLKLVRPAPLASRDFHPQEFPLVADHRCKEVPR